MDPSAPHPSESLLQRFPAMRPITRPPTLFNINGCGVSVYGKRDLDTDTGSYVKTHCVCFLFIPLLPLGAYRVVDAPQGGWYFLGKEPLSTLARAWNFVVLASLLALSTIVGWQKYTSTAEYKARQTLNAGAKELKAGQPLKAAQTYRHLLDGDAYFQESREGFRKAIEESLRNDSAAVVEGALGLVAGAPARASQPAPIVPDAFQRGLALVEKFRAQDPEGALGILQSTASIDRKNDAVKPLRIDLLKQVIAGRPDNTNRVIELAIAYDANNQLEESVKLLTPFQSHLGASEGARILGRGFLQQGRFDDAYALLNPYVQERLAKLHAIERNYTNTFASVQQRAMDDLRQGRGDRAFYEAYNRASEADRDTMVRGFVEKRLQGDPAVQRTLEELRAANQVVHVTLDLGIVQLNRAQGLKESAARKAELEAAEKTFLAIRGAAGETDEYRMFLGQVYYWLGRSKEGKDLFDQLLASNQRAFPILMALANTLRNVGEFPQARELAEEAYQNTKDQKQKFTAAALRAHFQKDTDDQIAWLERSNPEEQYIQVALNTARGRRSLEKGNKEEAAQFLRTAIASHQTQPKTSGGLNNWGLAQLDLYQATGNIEDHNLGLNLLEQAIELEPGNSVLLINTLNILLSRAVMDVVGDSIRFDLLGETPGVSLLAHLYNDEPEYNRLYARLREKPSMKKALAYLDKALLLAPKNIDLYQVGAHFYAAFRDLAELQKMQQRAQTAALDFSEARKEAAEAYSGKKDKEYLEKFQTAIRKLEHLAQVRGVKDHLLTAQYANVSLVGIRQNASLYGASVNSQQVLETAQTAYKTHPSSATRHSLVSAYMFKANDELARQDGEYALLVNRTRRALAPQYLIAALLERGGPSADLIRKNPNVQKALALEREWITLFPSHPRVDQWALLRHAFPAEAAIIATNLKQNALARLSDELQFQLAPMSSATVLEQHWTRKILGDEKGAATVYQEGVARGVPLPPL